MKKLILTALTMLLCIAAYAHKVEGTVTDGFGEPLPGVVIVVSGSDMAQVTDLDGRYVFADAPVDAVLEFNFLGMRTVYERVSGRSVINVALKEDAIGLQEAVAIGYGSMKREEITTSITSVKADDFVKGGVTSALQLLQGKVAGLGMSTSSGDPDASPSISLRGISTLAASSSPLVVIDGVAGGFMNSVAPEDIESIDVLKDGSAAAIYGTRGTNGVIIITTKRPQSGQATLDYEGYVKFDRMAADETRLSASEWRDMMNNADIPATVRATMQDYGADSDWVGAITRNPISHNHYLSARGGNQKTNYAASVSYSNRQGIYNNSNDEGLGVKFAVNHSMADDRIRLSLNLNNRSKNYGYVPEELYNNASLWNPTFPMYDENGEYYMTNSQTPICAANEWQGRIKFNQLSMSGKVEIEPVKHLVLSATGSYQSDYSEDEWWGTHKTYAAVYGSEDGYAKLSGGHGDDRTLDLQAMYSKSSGDHSYSASLGYNYNRYCYQGWSMTAYDFPVDGFGVWNMGSAQSTLEGMSSVSTSKWARKLIGFYGRVNYCYANRYLLMASLRREGSDKFGENNRWGWFPSVSVGWRLSNEDFMKNISWIDDLKLRFGFGVTGTEPSSAYEYIALYNFNSSYMSNVDGKWISGIVPTNNPNPDLKWEEKRETNLGLDFAFLANRIWGSVDAYYRHTKDLLYYYSVPTPPYLTGTMLANVGEISNKGIELQLNGSLIRTRNLELTASGNISFNSNILNSLSNDQYQLDYIKLGSLTHVQTYSHLAEPDQPIGNFYGWKQIGLKSQGTAWRIVGAENSTAGEDQKQVIGNGIPKMFAAFGFNLKYKCFDAAVSFRGAFKYQILNQYRMMYETLAWLQTYNVPRAAYEKIGEYYNTAPSTYCDYYIEDGDYLKMDNLTFGYAFDVSKIGFVKKARVYVTGKNLLTFTSYKGMDPEAVSITGLTPGIDSMTKYPTLKSVTCGVSVSF